MRYHAKGAIRTPEFICLAGIAGVIGNTIIGDYNTYEKSEEADFILRRAQMLIYFDQSTRTHKLPMENVIVQGINLSKNYLTDLLTKSEGGFRERVSTALSYLTIAARPTFDHIPTPAEQQTLPPTTPFFKNNVMRHLGITSRNSILRQTLTILGKDNIINIDDLKPSPNYYTYPTALYTLNLLQAGGNNKGYYRSREGTEDTLNKSAFVMASGQSSFLECTEDPSKYGIILRACDRAQTCMEFHTWPSDQNHWPKEQSQVWPPDHNKVCIASAQLMITHKPVSVITATRPITQTQKINTRPIKEEAPTTSKEAYTHRPPMKEETFPEANTPRPPLKEETSSEASNHWYPIKEETSTNTSTSTSTSNLLPPPTPPPNHSVISQNQNNHPPPRVHFQEAEYIENYERELAIDMKYHKENYQTQELTLDSQDQSTTGNQELALDRPNQSTSGNQELNIDRHYRASDKRPDDSESVIEITDQRPEDTESVIEVTEDNEVITSRVLPPQQGWSHQSTRSNTSNNRHHTQRQTRPNMRIGPYTNRIHNPNRPEMNHRYHMPHMNNMSHKKPTSHQHNPNRPNIIYGQDPKNTPCMYEPLPMGCRKKDCRFQHYNHNKFLKATGQF